MFAWSNEVEGEWKKTKLTVYLLVRQIWAWRSGMSWLQVQLQTMCAKLEHFQLYPLSNIVITELYMCHLQMEHKSFKISLSHKYSKVDVATPLYSTSMLDIAKYSTFLCTRDTLASNGEVEAQYQFWIVDYSNYHHVSVCVDQDFPLHRGCCNLYCCWHTIATV